MNDFSKLQARLIYIRVNIKLKDIENHSNSRPFKIVVACDDLEDFQIIKTVIVKIYPTVKISHVENGHYLMDLLKAQSLNRKFGELPNFILLDLNMPRKSGLEVLKEIKTHSILHSIPVIIFTTSAASEDVKNAYELGANCYVAKPRTAGEWESTLGDLIRFWIVHVIFPPVD